MDPRATLLHFREVLKENAEGCGKAADKPNIFAALRARFGLSPREAHSKLSFRKRGLTEVARLIQAAYGNLPAANQADIVLDTFCNALRHLLAIQVPTLEDAVHAGNEFLEVKMAGGQPNSNIRQMAKPSLPTNREMRGKLL